jgi:hypothetical protein
MTEANQARRMAEAYRVAQDGLIYIWANRETTVNKPSSWSIEASKAIAPDDAPHPAAWIRDRRLPQANVPLTREPLKAFFRRRWLRREVAHPGSCGRFPCNILFAEIGRQNVTRQKRARHAIYEHSLAVIDPAHTS